MGLFRCGRRCRTRDLCHSDYGQNKTKQKDEYRQNGKAAERPTAGQLSARRTRRFVGIRLHARDCSRRGGRFRERRAAGVRKREGLIWFPPSSTAEDDQ